jgi:hypothetical protein
MRAQQAKLYAYLSPHFALPWHAMYSIYPRLLYPFAQGDGGWLAPMAVDMVYRLAILVFNASPPSMYGRGAPFSRTHEYNGPTPAFMPAIRTFRRSISFPARRCLGLMEMRVGNNIFVVVHGTLGSHLHDALKECSCGNLHSETYLLAEICSCLLLLLQVEVYM